MIDLDLLDRHGAAWFVCRDLQATGNSVIVTPTPLRRDPQGAAGDRFCEENQLVVLGFVATILGGTGFYLKSLGQDGLFRIHYRHALVAATTNVISVPQCYIPLQRADFSNSPSMDPSSLVVETVGTLTLGSCISIWGIHTSHDWGGKGYTGSPVEFPQHSIVLEG